MNVRVVVYRTKQGKPAADAFNLDADKQRGLAEDLEKRLSKDELPHTVLEVHLPSA